MHQKTMLSWRKKSRKLSSRIGPFHFNHPVCYYIPSYNFMSCKNRYFVNEELLKCSNLCTSIELVIICPEDPENWFLTLFFHKTICTFIVFFDSDYSILLWWTFRFFRSYHHSLLCRLEKPFSNNFFYVRSTFATHVSPFERVPRAVEIESIKYFPRRRK